MSNKVKLITESSFDIEITESKDKNLHIVGIFSSADVENANKRKYRKSILERETNSLVEGKVSKKCCFGELSHPVDPEIHLDRVAIMTTQLEWRGNDLYGKAKILDTPMGSIAKTLIKEGRLGISSRGLGTVAEDGYVNDDFRLITYDLVHDASNPSSKFVNGIYEGKEFEIHGIKDEEEITEEVITEVQAKTEFKKHIWQVIEQIEKNL